MTNNLQFTRTHHVYGVVPYERRNHHARSLLHGLAMLGADTFVCEVCWRCKGHCVSRYDEGFGCNACSGTGLTQGGGVAPATDSMRNQVLIAATRSLLIDDVEIL